MAPPYQYRSVPRLTVWNIVWFALAVLAVQNAVAQNAPVVSNLSASQRGGTKLVDIAYDLDSRSRNLVVQAVSDSDPGFSDGAAIRVRTR